jgi:hypothetical protein
MAGVVTASSACAGGNHGTLTVTYRGQSYQFTGLVHTPLTSDEIRTFLELGIRELRTSGLTFAQLLNRVCVGGEATNVKQYDFLGPGNTVTKTNIGTTYVNVLPGLNGERIPVDLTGVTEFRVFLTLNMVGVGPLRARIIRDGDSTVLYENTNINVAAGERELDTGWLTIPAGFNGVELLRWQMSSATATDDPVFRRCGLLVR